MRLQDLDRLLHGNLSICFFPIVEPLFKIGAVGNLRPPVFVPVQLHGLIGGQEITPGAHLLDDIQADSIRPYLQPTK